MGEEGNTLSDLYSIIIHLILSCFIFNNRIFTARYSNTKALHVCV